MTERGMFRLDGKHALVCGSSQGIGRAAAEVLARQGATVTLAARDEAALRTVVFGLDRTAGQRHHVVVADFTDPLAVRQRVAAHVAAAAPVDILVNNTGGPKSGPILEAKPEEFTTAFAMHVVCNHLLVQALAPTMKERRWGRIINIISTSVREPIPGLGVSNTTRWAVASWAKTLSRELAPFGITVNNVLPGYTDTARLRALFESRAKREGQTPEQIAAATMAAVPAGRFATPDEIAAAVAFLASAEASYVNGVSLAVDGGRLGAM
jgi:3-oxoacyl-[acyl-carrier protein] reductase